MTIQTFKTGDRIIIEGVRPHYGTLHSLRSSYDRSDYFRRTYPDYEAFLAEMFRRQEGDRYIGYGIQDASVLVASSAMREHIAHRQLSGRKVRHGQIIELDGVCMRLNYVGDYSDFIKLYAL